MVTCLFFKKYWAQFSLPRTLFFNPHVESVGSSLVCIEPCFCKKCGAQFAKNPDFSPTCTHNEEKADRPRAKIFISIGNEYFLVFFYYENILKMEIFPLGIPKEKFPF